MPNWFHKDCFFKKQKPASVGDIKNFENLRFADQTEVSKLIGMYIRLSQNKIFQLLLLETLSVTVAGKRSKSKQEALKDFGIEYSKSGRATCRGCELKISKDEVRVFKTVYDTEIGMKYGGQKVWHHLECFAKMRSDVGWFDTGENLPGYKLLKDEDKEVVLKLLP